MPASHSQGPRLDASLTSQKSSCRRELAFAQAGCNLENSGQMLGTQSWVLVDVFGMGCGLSCLESATQRRGEDELQIVT